MVLQAAALEEFRGTNSQKAFSHQEAYLDSLVRRAQHRRPLVSERLKDFDDSLAWVARYRAKYPRPLSQGTGFYWTADRQTEVDEFLRQFNK
jgi:hypothetical protein